jgi:hypothetical protein
MEGKGSKREKKAQTAPRGLIKQIWHKTLQALMGMIKSIVDRAVLALLRVLSQTGVRACFVGTLRTRALRVLVTFWVRLVAF